MPQLEHIAAIEKRLWEAADTLRANSEYASNEYFLPVMGLVFLRHAYSRYLTVKAKIEDKLPKRNGKPRALTKEDFSQRGAIFLQPKAQFDHLVALPDGTDRAKAIMKAMKSIESDYSNLRGILPKSEYQKLRNDVLGQLLRTFNPEELEKVSGDVFGRIYEYFLTQFADQKAHDNGEFFTPISLVSLIAHVLDPDRGTVLDPACGSGGMFVQSARIVEEHGRKPTEQLTFRGLEKNETTIRLAKMNLAVHGLEGDIQQAITYYEDPQNLHGKANFVMANPPFNVDEIDADKIKADPRLPFGLPGINKKDKISNGNYIWISYFYSYLNKKGRAGFIMSSQASSAGGDEARVRQSLVETGDVDVMIAIRPNFFYTRSVPCELWFLNRAKPKQYHDKVLMIDARNIFREVTRKICDFSPEQQQNILSIVWLYRGESDKYLALIADYCCRILEECARCFSIEDEKGEIIQPLPDFALSLDTLYGFLQPFLKNLPRNAAQAKVEKELIDALSVLQADIKKIRQTLTVQEAKWKKQKTTNGALKKAIERLSPLAESGEDLIRQTDLLYKLATRLIKTCEEECDARSSDAWNNRDITRARKTVNKARELAVKQLKQVDYFWQQAHWLSKRFPEAKLRDVEGLVKLVNRDEIEAKDWRLTPGLYVGITPEEEDENFNFEEAMRNIHGELKKLNTESATLAVTIEKNFKQLGI